MSKTVKNSNYFHTPDTHDLFDDYANVQREIESAYIRLAALRSRVEIWPPKLLLVLDTLISDLHRHHDRISSLKNS